MSAPPIHTQPALPTTDGAGNGARPRRRGRRTAAVIVVAGLVVAAAVLTITDPFRSASASPDTADNAAPTGVATIARRMLSSQDQVNGTLGYDGSYTIVNNASGVFTWLPNEGDAIKPGDPLYWVDGKPVVLLYGRTPVYRALSEGTSGADVRELNADLVALGYATWSELGTNSDYFSGATATALGRLQDHLGVTETGTLALGDAVFAPGPLRISAVTATLGSRAGPGSPLARASSTRRQVVVSLDATQQADVRAGDRVDITLPDKSVTPGVVSSVGTVATSGSNGTTVEVDARPLRPRATGRLDQAPVQVAITTGTVRNALVVPVNALLALASGGYAVEVVGAQGARRLIPVTPGLFDDADGLVAISGAGLLAGEHVVVPASA
jgi:hypothetical protein